MSKRTIQFPVFPAIGGLEQSSIPGTADPGKMYDSENVILAINGAKKKFWGLTPYYRSGFTPTISGNMRGMIDFYRMSAGVQVHKVLAFAGGKMWADSVDGRFNDITGSAVLLPDDPIVFEPFVGQMMLFYKNHIPMSWDMSGNIVTWLSLCGATSPPEGSFARVHDRRLWVAGNKLAPHRLYYSTTDDPNDWLMVGPGADAGYIDIDDGDNDPIGITAIFPSFFGTLYVAKRKKLYKVVANISADLSTTIYSYECVSSGIGCCAHNSVAATPSDIIWASDRGIHSLVATDKHGDVEVSFLSWSIHKKWRYETNFYKAENMWAVYDPDMNSYLLAYTTRGRSKNTSLLCYNITLNEWYQRKTFDCAALCTYTDRKFNTRTLVGQEALNIGTIDQDFTSDFGVGKTMQYTTPIIYPAKNPVASCNFKKLWLLFKPQNSGVIKVTYQIDGKPNTTIDVPQTIADTSAAHSLAVSTSGSLIGYSNIGTAVIGGVSSVTGEVTLLGGGGQIKKYDVPLKGEGSGIQLMFTNEASTTAPNEDCEIYGFMIEVELAEDSSIPAIQ